MAKKTVYGPVSPHCIPTRRATTKHLTGTNATYLHPQIPRENRQSRELRTIQPPFARCPGSSPRPGCTHISPIPSRNDLLGASKSIQVQAGNVPNDRPRHRLLACRLQYAVRTSIRPSSRHSTGVTGVLLEWPRCPGCHQGHGGINLHRCEERSMTCCS